MSTVLLNAAGRPLCMWTKEEIRAYNAAQLLIRRRALLRVFEWRLSRQPGGRK